MKLESLADAILIIFSVCVILGWGMLYMQITHEDHSQYEPGRTVRFVNIPSEDAFCVDYFHGTLTVVFDTECGS